MRAPDLDEYLVNKVCVCDRGRPALVVSEAMTAHGKRWVGIGFDGQGIWQSKQPLIIAESPQEYYANLNKT